MDAESSKRIKLDSILHDECLNFNLNSLPLKDLREITNNFSDENLLGQGGFGTVYKGLLPNGNIIAVKKLTSTMPGLQDKQYENEVRHLMRLTHPNIVQLVGYCFETEKDLVEYKGRYVYAEKSERLLCLEYLHKGSLCNYISGASSGLDWDTRYKIIVGICYGLHYLHEEWRQPSTPIIHRDLKPANILLDDNMVPKIADFGLSRLFGEEQTRTTTKKVDGTLGYMAPEYLHRGIITKELDIFSLGVIIIQVVTGQKHYPYNDDKTSSQEFIELVLEKWRNRLDEVPGYTSQEFDCQQIRRCIDIGLLCVKYDRVKRPTTSRIIEMLAPKDAECSNEREDKLVSHLDPTEDAKRFVLPTENKFAAARFNGFASITAALAVKEEVVAVAAPDSSVLGDSVSGGGRGRKNQFYDDDDDDLEMDRRSSKQSALQEDGDDGDVFDKYMITSHEMCVEQMENPRIAMQEEAPKKEGGVRTLLIHCAHAVASDDHRNATELLKQIKQRASPQGDATQRLAHCFAEGLQVRLAGTGSMVYQSLMAKKTSAVNILQAHRLYMAAVCFNNVVFMFSNQTIYNASLGKKKIHIVDYGIHYGFQWPCFLRRIACREGGPPEVRITGIDLPQPGFRPTQRIEETGRRLSKYAQEFGVPFKYQAIAASKIEIILAEDLNLDPEEVLIVNCLHNFKNLMDENVLIESPRDIVLNNIRKMKPHAFVHAISNGSFSAPSFLTRFREALFYYSALFDILDTTTPRDSNQRMLIEQNIFGRAALNAIACEGTDRVERPETYEQWQVRSQRAGLKQLPLNPGILQEVRDMVNGCYHKDFVIDIDHNWLLQGWKDRILFAISTWEANDDAGRVA